MHFVESTIRFAEWWARSISDRKRLQRRYRVLTDAVAWVAVSIATALVVLVMYKTRTAFGLPLEAGSLEGLRTQFMLWIATCLLSIPIAIYGCMVAISGAVAMPMTISGRLTRSEATRYVFFGRYPMKWFRGDA